MSVTSIAAASVATGVTAVTMAALGVEPQQLVIATIGAGVGSVAAPELGRIRATLMFVCVVCLCAILGQLVAEAYIGSGRLARNAVIGVLAALFHPMFSMIVAKLPELFDGALRRLGLKQ